MDKKEPDGAGAPSVLITGGSGLVGRYLTSLLLSEGYAVSHLSRKSNNFGKVRVYRWDPEKGVIDPLILRGVDYIIHLAGAGIGDKRWSNKRRKEIAGSRVNPVKLLHSVVTANDIPLKGFISASATGYYGSITSDRIYVETDPPADDFLATVCRLWEEAADLFRYSGIRTVKIRTAVVLEKHSGVLARMLIPAEMGIFPVLGKGSHYMPWIHISDLCRIYLKAIADEEMEGVWNAAAPEHKSQLEFIKGLKGAMGKSGICPPVPGFLLKSALGSMSDIVLKGSRVSSEKLTRKGFDFKFPDLGPALKDLLQKD